MKALRILVVEDDAVIAVLLSDMLSVMGHVVDAIATTEREAVAAAVRCRPDLMIVDAQLREGSGMSAMEKILRTGHVPHLFTSGTAIPSRSSSAILMPKPFDEADLLRAIEQALAVGNPS